MAIRPVIAAIAAATVIAAVAGFFLGRSTAPARVEVREKVVEKTVEVAGKAKESASVEAENIVRRDETRRVVHEVRHRDGTVERTATSEAVRSSEAAAKREEQSREVEVRYVDKFIDRETVKVVEAKATWGIAARAGIASGPRAIYGAEVSRRVLGPLWLGVYADTTKAAGVQVRWEF